MIPAVQVSRFSRALPFWLPVLLLPLAWFCAVTGGLAILLMPIVTWYMFSVLDAVGGLETENADPETPESDLFWYRAITVMWPPLQFATLFGMIWYETRAEHLNTLESILMFFGVGVITGTIGITYSHELMHKPGALERNLGDLLLALVLYGHFRSEHLLVHIAYLVKHI